MQALSDDLLKGADAAAAYIGVASRWQVYRMTAAGELPAIRKGRLIFYRKSDLDRAFSCDAAQAA